ncbi:MAG: hypothetical protein ACXACG_07010 [Candidatus Thorarchaeota archaeon]
MRTCPKCGRANQPTRKYCIRCGGNLLSVERKPQTISSPTETPVTPEPEVTEAQPPATTPSEARVTTNDEWVKPSQVSPDRVRSAEGTLKPKSEMEKAQEAFAKADQVGIEETGEGIIETRMLRASEVQELMGDLETQPEVSAVPPSAPPPAAAPPTPPASTPPPAAPLSTPPATPKPSVPVQPEATPPPEKIATPEPAAPPPKPRMPDIAAKTPSPAAPPAKPTASSIPEISAILSILPDPAYKQDPQIIGIVNDLTNLHTELAQFNSDLDNVRSRLESEVRDYWNVAEVKRIHFESIEEQLRLAKQEWNDSTKVYQKAAKRMSNELNSREKRIKDIEKRIKKTGDSIGKRAKDLDKEKAKRALSS